MMTAFLFLVVFCLVVNAFVRSDDVGSQMKRLERRIEALENRISRSQTTSSRESTSQETITPKELTVPSPAPESTLEPVLPKPIPTFKPKPFVPAKAVSFPVRSDRVAAPPIDWEKFMGVKLFSWLGGFALFLGAAFFVKYSIDHNLISPLMRVTIGFIVGIGIIFGGLLIRGLAYRVTAQTLCAAGVAVLYADTFACRSLYSFISNDVAFGLMALMTVVSFLLAVRLTSQYVAVLGLLGGFLTPVLLSTGVDHPVALFSYILLLDTGLSAVALRQRWGFLIALSAAGTLIMETGWTVKFLTVAKGPMAAGIYVLFSLFFLATAEAARKKRDTDPMFHAMGATVALLSMGFVAYFMTFHDLAARPGLTLTLLLGLGAQLAYMAVRWEENRPLYIFGSLVSFVLLAFWTENSLKANLLLWGLGFDLAFAVLHSMLPIVLQRLRPSQTPWLWGYAAPVAMLLLVILAMVSCDVLSFFMWPFIFLLGFLAIAAAWLAGSILAAGATLGLIMISFGVWIFRLPDAAGLPGILALLAFFACAFFAWALVVTRRKSLFSADAAWSKAGGIPPEDAAQLPMLAALMPFMLLAMICLQLPLKSPSDLFGLMALMLALLFGLVRYRGLEALSVIALACTVIVEMLWHLKNFTPATGLVAPLWYFGFYGVFTLLPVVMSKSVKTSLPWIASALAGPAHFVLFYCVWHERLDDSMIGALPAMLSVPSLLALYQTVRSFPQADPRRKTVLAVSGGAALFFITLIIPLQWSNEWITLGWSLEGAALLWLFRRIPHEGLKAWGTALLGISFARLAFNPAVFSYHPRTEMAFFNWYLGLYGAAALSFFAAAKWLEAPRNLWRELDLPPVFNSLGVVLVFLLLNIEIANYFSTGRTITFEFSGSLGRDMTYSLAWAAFSITLLLTGIQRKSQGARYASIGLLTVTLCKLFMHDLWSLGGLYRVASFVGLAIVLILVSFVYQWFLNDKKNTEVSHGS